MKIRRRPTFFPTGMNCNIPCNVRRDTLNRSATSSSVRKPISIDLPHRSVGEHRPSSQNLRQFQLRLFALLEPPASFSNADVAGFNTFRFRDTSNIIRSFFLVAGAAQKPRVFERRFTEEAVRPDVINFKPPRYERVAAFTKQSPVFRSAFYDCDFY